MKPSADHSSPSATVSPVYSTLPNPPVNLPRSASPPIVPLTPNGLLIPFKPSNERADTSSRSRLRPLTGFPTPNGRKYDLIQEQIRQRARLLDQLKQKYAAPAPALPVMSPGTLARTSSTSSGSTPLAPPSLPFRPPPPPSFSVPSPFASTFPSSGINPPKPSAQSSSSSSSSSSSRSSRSSSNAPSSRPSAYARQPYGSLLSGPSAAYSSLQP